MRLEISVAGINVVKRDLLRFADRAQNIAPARDEIARILAEDNRRNFESEGAAGSYGRWKPLSPAYARWKQRHYPGRKILVRTGKLSESLTRVPMGIQDATRDRITLGTDIYYAQYHQTGGRRLPRRPPIALTEQVKRDMVKVLERYLVENVP